MEIQINKIPNTKRQDRQKPNNRKEEKHIYFFFMLEVHNKYNTKYRYYKFRDKGICYDNVGLNVFLGFTTMK